MCMCVHYVSNIFEHWKCVFHFMDRISQTKNIYLHPAPPQRPRIYDFCIPLTLKFPFFRLHRSRIILRIILIEIGPKHAQKILRPPPRCQSPCSPTNVKSWSRHCFTYLHEKLWVISFIKCMYSLNRSELFSL